MTSPSVSAPTTRRPTHLRTLSYRGLAPGPRLLVLGAVHGNEVCGTHAITQILTELDSGTLAVERG
ncbi:MAG: succinylglutamate desuccinylase, partial [Polaromonas sp.]